MVSTGNAIRDQLAQIMEEHPETIDDEDLLAAKWLLRFHEYTTLRFREHEPNIVAALRYVRKANIRERRRELKDLYPFSEEEEARRQKRGKEGPPG